MISIQSLELVVKNSVKAVLVPLKDSICTLNVVYKTLIDTDVDPVSGICSNYSTIREQIMKAEQSLKRSEQEASSGLIQLDNSLQKLTQEKQKLEQTKDSTEQILHNLKINVETYEKLLKTCEGALEHAQTNLDSARLTLENQESKKSYAETIWTVGMGLLAVPVLGWIAGSIMAAVSSTDFTEASIAIKNAEFEVREARGQVDTYKRKVSEYTNMISQTKVDINQNNTNMETINRNIQDVKSKTENLAEFQVKVRHAHTTLSVITGRASVLEHQTRKFIAKQPVMTVMEEVMKAAEQISGNQLLCNNGMLSLIDQMKASHQRLAAICDI